MYQEQEAELEVLKERKVTTEAYIEELRARVSKLGEREASTEVGAPSTRCSSVVD